MSESTAQPNQQERSLGVEIARTSAISAAANAAGIAGVIGTLVLFSRASRRYTGRHAQTETPMESETTES